MSYMMAATEVEKEAIELENHPEAFSSNAHIFNALNFERRGTNHVS